MILLAFILFVMFSGAVVVLSMCQSAAAGDRAMAEYFRENSQPPTSNIEHPMGGAR